jgi:hypothetical protein
MAQLYGVSLVSFFWDKKQNVVCQKSTDILEEHVSFFGFPCYPLYGSFFVLLFIPEDGGDMFLRNVG